MRRSPRHQDLSLAALCEPPRPSPVAARKDLIVTGVPALWRARATQPWGVLYQELDWRRECQDMG